MNTKSTTTGCHFDDICNFCMNPINAPRGAYRLRNIMLLVDAEIESGVAREILGWCVGVGSLLIRGRNGYRREVFGCTVGVVERFLHFSEQVLPGQKKGPPDRPKTRAHAISLYIRRMQSITKRDHE